MSITFSSNQMDTFAQDPANYVLRLHNNEIFTEKKGIWTWMKSKVFCRNEYKLSNIVNAIQKIDSRSLTDPFVKALNAKIAIFNNRHKSNTAQQIFKQAILPTSSSQNRAPRMPPIDKPEPPTQLPTTSEQSSPKDRLTKSEPDTTKPVGASITQDRVTRALEKVNVISQTLEEDIKEYVQTYLHPYVTGEITRDKDSSNRHPMIEKMLNEIRKHKPLTDEEVTKIKQIAFSAYITEEAKRAFVREKEIGMLTRKMIDLPSTFRSDTPLIELMPEKLRKDKTFKKRFAKATENNKKALLELPKLAKDYPDAKYQIDNLLYKIEEELKAIATAKQSLLTFLEEDIKRDFPGIKGLDMDKVADEAFGRLKIATQITEKQVNKYTDDTMPLKGDDHLQKKLAKLAKLKELEKRGHLFMLPEVPQKLSNLLEEFVPPLDSKQPALLSTDDEFEIRWRFRQFIDSKPDIKNIEDFGKNPQYESLKQYVEALEPKLSKKHYFQLSYAVAMSITEELTAKNK